MIITIITIIMIIIIIIMKRSVRLIHISELLCSYYSTGDSSAGGLICPKDRA